MPAISTSGPPGSKTIPLLLQPWLPAEPDETFLVNLSGAVGAVVADAQGIGTMVNDDGVPAAPADIPTLGEWQLIALALLLIALAPHATRRRQC